MPSDFGNLLMIVMAFGLVVIFVAILKSNPPKLKYEDSFPGGKNFPDDMLKRFEKMRKENNPNDEPIGIINGRCHYCGSTKIDQEWKPTAPFNLEKEYIKNCCRCNLVVASM